MRPSTHGDRSTRSRSVCGRRLVPAFLAAQVPGVRAGELTSFLYRLYSLDMKRPERKGVEQARNELPRLIEAAEAGNSTVITKRGRPIAALVPLDSYSAAPRQRSLLALAGTGPKLWGGSSGRTIAKLRDEWGR